METKVIKDFAVACGAEVAIASAFTAVAAGYAAQDVKVALIAAGVFAVVKIVACRGVKFFVDLRAEHAKGWESNVLNVASYCLSFGSAYALAGLDFMTRNVLVHEYGHVAAGNLVFANVKFVVSITGIGKGITAPIALAGKQIMGFSFSQLVFTAGGPMMALMCVCAMIGLAKFYGDAYEGFGEYLTLAALLSIMQHVKYAASAFDFPNMVGHDFARMAKYGIDPRLWIAAFVLVPLVWMAVLNYSTMTKPCSDTEPALPIESF